MTFNHEDIDTLDYFDSRDVVERLNATPAESVEAKTLLHLLEGLTEEFPPSKYMDVRTDTDCGVQGFAEHYAEQYAREFASDVAGMDRSEPWPFNHIDWSAAAEALKTDYTEVEILGATFYLRD